MDRWEVFTQFVGGEGSAELRWFWRCYGAEGSKLESSAGFHSRAECQADAAKHGCKGDLELLLHMDVPALWSTRIRSSE
jgi:hypothetical protein